MIASLWLTLASLAQAAPARRAVLLGHANDSALRRIANELRVAGYEVLVVPSEGKIDDVTLAQVADEREALAVVSVSTRAEAAEVVVYVVDRVRAESTLRRLVQRSGDPGSVDQVIALRIVEVLNAALLELERKSTVPRGSTAAVLPDARLPPPTRRADRAIRLGVSAQAQATWLLGGLPPFFGPALSARLVLPSGLFLGVAGFASASKATLTGRAGSADIRIFEATLRAGFEAPLWRNLDLGCNLALGWLGAWASAEPAVGFRERDARSLSALVIGQGELGLRIFEHMSFVGALGFGVVLPRLSLRQASTEVAVAGPWLASAGVGIVTEWEP